MSDVTMPRLSDSMEEGTILAWLVPDGSYVLVGQPLAEVETDKATMTFDADAEGPIQILANPGDTVPLGGVIARIQVPYHEPRAAELAAPVEPRDAGAESEAPRQHKNARWHPARGLPGASPIARRVAAALNIDLRSLVGTGPRGRILRADVERAAASGVAPPAARRNNDERVAAPRQSAADPSAPPSRHTDRPSGVAGAKGTVTRTKLTRAQELVARRVARSRATVPDFTVSVDVDIEAACLLCDELTDMALGGAPSLRDLVIVACARTLTEQPKVNSAYRDGNVELYSRVNIGVAIAARNELIVPTILDADRRSLREIAHTTCTLVAKARGGLITPAELAGATFTVTNLDMFDVDWFTAIVDPAQAAILAVGAVRRRAVAHAGGLAMRRQLTLTVTADHRVLYGADAARFVERLRTFLERPLRLMLPAA